MKYFSVCLVLFILIVPMLQAESGGLRLEASVAFLEGPAWHPDGTLYFTDIPNNKIMRWAPKSRPQVHRTPSGHANGLVFDAEGRLLIAEDDGRLMRENQDGTVEVLADTFNGAPFNSLNDLALDTKGRIYFTDPRFRNPKNATQRDKNGQIIHGVYCYDENGKVARILDGVVQTPNGIVVSPNDQFLYVGDNDGQSLDGIRKIWQFKLDQSGKPDAASKKEIFDFGQDRGPDGMAIDTEGNLYVAAGRNFPRPTQMSKVYKAGIYIISPTGELLDFIAIPDDTVSNVTFGGDKYKTLYITAGHSIWSHSVNATGYLPYARPTQ